MYDIIFICDIFLSEIPCVSVGRMDANGIIPQFIDEYCVIIIFLQKGC